MQDGTSQRLPLCSTLSALGPQQGACYSSVQQVPLAYNAEPWWMTEQAQCQAPADCKCTGGAPGNRVLQFVSLPLLDRPCNITGRAVAMQPKCQARGAGEAG